MPQLQREEYIEQAYFFKVLGQRIHQNESTQDLIVSIRDEILSTTKLPLALDFMASELKLEGIFAPAMSKLSHYFTAFQTYVISAAEDERGKFDLAVALEILKKEAQYRAKEVTPAGLFLYQFECLCRNRLSYDKGLEALAIDSIYDQAWKDWITTVRRQVGLIDIADLIYVRSEYYHIYANRHQKKGQQESQQARDSAKPTLFGEKEGRIALANRLKDPKFLFAALQRQLAYPSVPRPEEADESQNLIPMLMRRMERLESRLRILEEEQRGGLDITQFYEKGSRPSPEQ